MITAFYTFDKSVYLTLDDVKFWLSEKEIKYIKIIETFNKTHYRVYLFMPNYGECEDFSYYEIDFGITKFAGEKN